MRNKVRYTLSHTAVAVAAAGAVTAAHGPGMTVSPEGVQAIMQFEDCRGDVYRDSAGHPTVGCGSLLENYQGIIGVVLSKEEVEKLFVADLVPFTVCVRDALKKPATKEQFGAMVSLAFNVGCGAFVYLSSVLRYHNAGQCEKAADAFLLWNKVRKNGKLVPSDGLDNRRRKERKMYLNGCSAAA